MKKTTKISDVYKPNSRVTVTVTNKPNYEEEALIDYKQTVTIKVEAGIGKDKLVFANDEELADFIANVDVDDPQQKLV